MRRRRAEAAGGYEVWPGFTGALSGLLSVLVFLVTVFVSGEIRLGREISGRDDAIGELRLQLARLQAQLAVSERRAVVAETRAAAAEAAIGDRELDAADLRAALAQADAQRLRLDADVERSHGRLAQLQAAVDRLQQALALVEAAGRQTEEARAGELDAVRRQAAAALERAHAEAAATLADERARAEATLAAERRSAEAERQQATAAANELLARLESERAALAAQVEEQDRALAAVRETLAERDTSLAAQAARLQQLDERLRQLAAGPQSRAAAEFFERLRAQFDDDPGVRIADDRFVFPTEDLFGPGEAVLGEAGRLHLDRFAGVGRQLPEDLIIEVIGHTDRTPIRVSRFRSNRELSMARAQAVVDYLVHQGVPPQRLAAVGMGEFHPLDGADTPEAYRRNRRIELKVIGR